MTWMAPVPCSSAPSRRTRNRFRPCRRRSLCSWPATRPRRPCAWRRPPCVLMRIPRRCRPRLGTRSAPSAISPRRSRPTGKPSISILTGRPAGLDSASRWRRTATPRRPRRRWRARSSATRSHTRPTGRWPGCTSTTASRSRRWERALRLQPDRGEAHEGIAEALLAAKRPAEARRHAEEALRRGRDVHALIQKIDRAGTP